MASTDDGGRPGRSDCSGRRWRRSRRRPGSTRRRLTRVGARARARRLEEGDPCRPTPPHLAPGGRGASLPAQEEASVIARLDRRSELQADAGEPVSQPPGILGRGPVQSQLSQLHRRHAQVAQLPADRVEGREIHEREVGPVLLVPEDPLVVVDEVAAAVEDKPVAIDLDRARMMRRVPVDASTPPSTSRRAKRTCAGGTSYPQFVPQWIDATVMSPLRFDRPTRAATAAAVSSKRSERRSTPARSSLAAQDGGIPLVSVPVPCTTTRRSSARSTTTGRWASASVRPAPVRVSPARSRVSSVSISPAGP